MVSQLKNALNVFYVIFFIILTSSSFAQDASETISVDGIRASLQQIEATLERKDLSDKELLDLRGRVEPLVETLKEYIAKQSPKLEGLKARIDQLTPKDAAKIEPKPSELKSEGQDVDAKTPAVDNLSLTKEREDQARILKETDANLRNARYEAERGQQILNTISERRRVLFTRALLDRSQPLISPALWLNIAQILPNELRLIGRFFGEWWESARQNLDLWRIILLAGFIFALLFFAPRVLRFVYKFEGRVETTTSPTRLKKAITALRIIFGATIAPSAICFLSYLILKSLGLISGKVDDLVLSLTFGISFLFFARAMNRALIPVISNPIIYDSSKLRIPRMSAGGRSPLASEHGSNWRIFEMRDELAIKLQWVVASVSLSLVIGKLVEALFHAIVAPLSLIIAIKGVTAVIVAIIIIQALRSLSVENEQVLEDETCLGPNTSSEPEKANWLRLVGWAFCAVILAAAAAGFIALASFLSTQIVWAATVIILLILVLIIIDEVIGRGMSSEGLLGRQMKNSVGLKTGSIDQISIISSGLLRLVVFFIALFLVLAPWGVDSGDLTGYLKSAFFGFSVAGVTISFSTIASALIIFILGVTLTRSIQRWLELRYLPITGLDIGLRNSIKTIFGYVGILIASALAFSAAGLSLDKLTIVAGALSVGIGFGLQSIVNNFVSGLILLWERPLRVGDWIAVGGEEGIVKRINVRATEIETFDKASLIVPNSEFISGRVKNWVHSNRQARIIIPISVKNSTDPKRIEAILNEVALAHRDVLSQPAPRVLFMKITDSSLDFELRCIVDVDAMATTRSELLFALYARLQTEGIDMPMTTRTVEIADMDRLGSAIAASMAVVDKKLPV